MQPRSANPDHSATDQHPPPAVIHPPPEYVRTMRPHSSKPDHSATDQHPPPAVIHPPPATPTACSGMNRQELENCIRRQVNRDLCKNYNIC
ncbi:hypothetical protein KY290_023941 [Solanum tuberosum]|uniref:Uncharacterized protein n=1 Tax=Solanum tuberosum TaxID=4113 RepID=A0ABQ7UPD0_SOLTU|nr:hypothetical protein KY284_022845 [Solanum tuberosum]KAH0674910.1 hypothetical protein KY285_022711 [Solanum tuberosum]KAH0753671.1 hypothetical protein KY290_023941 [Solanum tuberosum]